jgi:hypothetical protein
MGSLLFKTLTVGYHSSCTQFVPRPLCAKEILTLQLPSPVVGIGSSLTLSLSLSLSLSLTLKNSSFKLYCLLSSGRGRVSLVSFIGHILLTKSLPYQCIAKTGMP